MTQEVFLLTLIVVDIALIIALISWIMIWKKVSGKSKTAATFFVTCFLLYSIGQTLVILDVMELPIDSDISSYMYAVAAVFFAIGSVFHYRGLVE